MDEQNIEDLFRAPSQSPAQPNAAPPSVGGAGIEDLFREETSSLQPTWLSTATAPLAGFNIGARNLMGMPVDIVNWTLRQAGAPVSERPFMGSEFLKDYFPEKVEPRGGIERALQAGGEGAAYALAPQAGLEIMAARAAAPLIKSAPTGVTAKETAQKLFGARQSGSLPATAENIALNVGAGAGAQTAGEMVESKYRPLAELVGGVAGGGASQLVTEGVKAVPQLFTGLYRYLEPSFGSEAQRRVASRKLAEGATSPARSLDILENEPGVIVPGSRPTTFEMTGDTGLGQLQRKAETQSPEPFIQRQGEQAVAREEALSGVAPEGAPTEVSRLLRQQLDAFDQSETQAAQQAEARVRTIIERMGGDVTPEDAGRIMREELQRAKTAARDERSRLYNLIDPDQRLNAVSTGLRETSARIAAESADPLAKPLEGELKAIVEVASGVGDVIPFNTLRQFDTRISDAMRAELMSNGETNTYRQLKMMKDGVMDAINNAVENQQRYEAGAVASGSMSSADTLEQRLRSQWGVGEASPRGAGEPNLRPENVAALDAAKAAQKTYAGTFREGPVGEVLRPGKSQGQYKKQFDAEVGPTFFRKGNTGAQAMEAFQRASANNPGADQAMREYIVTSMLRETVDPRTGLIDEKSFNTWRRKHESALSAVPQIDRLFTSVADASRNATEIAAAARSRIEQAQRSAFSKIIGANDAETVARSVGDIFGKPNAASEMRRLASSVGGDPDARAGLQRAVVDYIRNRFLSTTEAGASDALLIKSSQFQNFVRQNRRTLSQVLSPEQVDTFQALANDLHRSNRSLTGSALRGRSTTAQDIPAATEKAQSMWSSIAKMTGPIVTGLAGQQLTGTISGALAGFAGGTVAAIAQSMRAAGMRNVDELISEALLNPEVARELLRLSTKMKGDAPARKLSETLVNTVATGSRQPLTQGDERQQEPRELTIPGSRPARASGGAVNLNALAKVAKKHVTTSTEQLLNQNDDTVARALEIANKNI
jgi:hypothetical protein